jgi:hypothetical protein
MLTAVSADSKNAATRGNASPHRAAHAEAAPPVAALGNQASLRLLRKCDCASPPDCDCDMGDDKKKKEKDGPRTGLHRAAASPSAPETVPRIVGETLRSPGQTLDPQTQAFFETRFGQDFSGVRIHTDTRAAQSAQAVKALAYTVGSDIAFASGRFAPATGEGRRLLAHELAHVVQQPHASEIPERVSEPSEPMEQHAERMESQVMAASGPAAFSPTQTGSAAPATVARQPASPPAPAPNANDPTNTTAPVDKWKGTLVSEIVISKARSRVGFRIPSGMLLGKVTTDLKVGTYDITPVMDKKQWLINGPDVKAGARFDVDLTESGADPWTLSYPAKLTLTVAGGSAGEPKTYGESIDPTTGQQKDPLWLYEGFGNAGPPAPIADDDDYETITIDKPSVTPGATGKTMQAPVYVVHYRDKTEKRLVYGELTPKMKQRLAPMFQKADEEFTMFTLTTFPMWWSIVSITPLLPMKAAGARPYIPKRVPLAPADPAGVVPGAAPGVAPGANPGANPAAAAAVPGSKAPVPGGAAEPPAAAPAAAAPAQPEAAPAPAQPAAAPAAAQPEAAPAPAQPEAAPAPGATASATNSAVAPMFQSSSGPGVAVGTEASARLGAQGLKGPKLIRPMIAELNSNPTLTPMDKATAMRTACNKTSPGTFGAGPIAKMPNNDLVVTSREAMVNAPVVIVKSNGTVVAGRADIAQIKNPANQLVTGFNVSNVRETP